MGSHLAERLLADGHEVCGVDCLTDYDAVQVERENAVALDLAELDLAEVDLAGVDTVFHLAGQPGTRSFGPVFADYLRRNTLATQRLFESAAVAGAKVRLCVVAFRLGGRRVLSDHRGDDPPAELPLRARLRVARRRLQSAASGSTQ